MGYTELELIPHYTQSTKTTMLREGCMAKHTPAVCQPHLGGPWMKCSPYPEKEKPLEEQEWVEKQLLGPDLLVLDILG